MTEEELNRFLMGEGGVGRGSDRVFMPNPGQPGSALEYARPPMPSILGAENQLANAERPIPTADEVALPQQVVLSSNPGSTFPTPIADSVGQYSQVNPMMEQQSLTPSNPFIELPVTPVTNVDLMGRPLREQPPVEEIRRRSDADGLGGDSILYGNLEEERAARQGFVEGLKRVFTDFSGEKMRQERYAPRDVDPNPPIAFTPKPLLADTRNPFFQAPIDLSSPGATTGATTAPTGEPIELPPLTRNEPEIPRLEEYEGTNLPGGIGFQRSPEGMVKSIGPDGKMIFTTPEQANIIASSMNGLRPSSTGVTGATGAEGSVTVDQVNGLTEPTRTGSRVGEFSDDVKGFFREGISGAGGLFEYFTDPNSSTLESIFERRKESLEAASEADDRARRGILQRGEEGSIQQNFVDRMATGQPLTQAETASAMEFARFNNLNFDPRVGFSQAPMATAPQGSPNIVNSQGFRGPAVGMNQPTLSSINAMAGTAPMATAPQGRPALSAYEQASMDREGRIAARDIRPGETRTQRDTRIAQSRTQGANLGSQLSQSDLRDIAKGSARGASTGDRARALEIQQRAGIGAFKPRATRVDKLSQATSMVDRMISNGQLSPEKRNAAIQKIVGLGAGAGAAGSADAGVIGSAEFDRVASQLQEGGSLYNMGIRVDPSVVDPLTGAAQIYREKPGFEFGPPERLPVSQELTEQLLPYARSVRQGGTMTQDFTGIGMKMNQFAGSR